MTDNDDDMESGRIAARLEVVDALLWACEHASELLTIVTSETTGTDAIRRLTEPPFAFTEFQAHHMLDLPFRRLSRQNVGLLRDEAARLRRGESTATAWQP